MASPRYTLGDAGPEEQDITWGPQSDHNEKHNATPLLVQSSQFEYEENEPNVTKAQQRFRWMPLFLRRWVMLSIAAALVSMIVILEVLRREANSRQGFGPVSSDLHYVWVYVPVSVVILLTACWTQIEQRIKQLAPWFLLATGPQSVENSLLLDYVSPNTTVSFYKSLRRRHWVVALSIGGSFLFNVLYIISTALFVLQTQTVVEDVPINAKDRFGRGNFSLDSVDGSPALTSAGVLLGKFGYPAGTNEQYATQSLDLLGPDRDRISQYSLAVPGETFSGSLSCEKATNTSKISTYCPPWSGCTSVTLYMGLSSESCTITEQSINQTQRLGVNQNGLGIVTGTIPIACDNPEADPQSPRLVVYAFHWDAVESSIPESNFLICSPKYSIAQRNMTIDYNEAIHAVGSPQDPRLIDHLTESEVMEATIASTDRATILQSIENQGGFWTYRFIADPFASIINVIMAPNNISEFLKPDFLIEGANAAYSSVSAQIAKQYLLQDDSRTLQGTVTYKAQRLFVRDVSLRLMEATIAVLLAVIAGLIFVMPPTATPEDTSSIGHLATVLARSPDISRELYGKGCCGKPSIRKQLNGSYYSALQKEDDGQRTDFMILSQNWTEDFKHEENHKCEGFWRPAMASTAVRICFLVVSLIMIGVLEGLYHRSEDGDGLADVYPDTYMQYFWLYIPAFVMVLLKLWFGSIDFYVRILDPYHQLSEGTWDVRSSLLASSIPKISLYGAVAALWNRRYGLATSSMTILFVSGLTVAVSGLYTPELVTYENPINLTTTDRFNYTAQFSGVLNGTDQLSIFLVTKGDLDYPIWTTEEFDLPSIAFPVNEEAQISALNLTSTTVRVPVQRGNLDCTVLPEESVFLDKTHNFKMLKFPTRLECSSGGTETQSECIYCQFDVDISNGKKPPAGFWGGKSFGFPEDGPVCPTMYLYYGHNQGNDVFDDVTIMTCQSRLEEMQADVEFALPSWDIVSVKPDETTLRTVKAGIDTQFKLPEFWDNDPVRANTSQFVTGPLRSIIYEPDGSENLELLRRKNTEEFIDRTRKLYQKVVAQVIDVTKIPHSGGAPETVEVLQGIAKASSRWRLKQNEIPTRILEAFFGAIVVCGLVSIFLLKVDHVVAKNPCSIAATASLLAESEMLRYITPGSEWMSDRELEHNVYGGHFFSLGWWHRADGLGSRYGIDVGQAVRPQIKRRGWRPWRTRAGKIS